MLKGDRRILPPATMQSSDLARNLGMPRLAKAIRDRVTELETGQAFRGHDMSINEYRRRIWLKG